MSNAMGAALLGVDGIPVEVEVRISSQLPRVDVVGLAGAAYSLGVKPGWGRPQGAEGMGWIALALVIFGGWHPLKVAAGALLFAFLQVVGIPLQDALPGVPTQVIGRRVAPTDIAATLAAYLGVKPPSGSVGSVLTEVLP